MIDALTTAFANFTFLRPWWLVALALLPLVLLVQRRRLRAADGWQQAVDPHLLPYLLQGAEKRGSRGASSLLFLGLALSVLALAGPSWRSAPAPLWQVEAPLLIALDLSSAMTATDLAPNRLTQARAKIRTLLEQRRGGQVGLLVFADDAFTVAPITRDAKTVQALLDSLSPDLMPVDGQRVDRAIAHAARMLANGAFKRGEILVVSDHADSTAQLAATRALGQGFRVSALGIGTLAGSPIANKNGFVTDSAGQVQLARLDPASLTALASIGGGRYVGLSIDDSDLTTLGVLDAHGAAQAGDGAGGERAGDNAAQRVDDGYWLILAVLPLALLGFRRGWLAVLWLAQVGGVFLLLGTAPTPVMAVEGLGQSGGRASGHSPDPQDADPQAPEPSAASEFWSRLWKRDDQRARDALEHGDTERARSLAPDADLRGSAAYRGEDYAAAAEEWAGQDHADAHYNRGNALAREGKLKDAIAAYDEALERAPGMEDAIANRKAVEDLLKQQQQQKQDGEQQDGEQQDGEQQDGEQQDGEQQDGEQQDGEQKDGEQKDGEQKDGEQKDGEQKDGAGKEGEEPKPEDTKSPSSAELAERKAAEEAARQEMQEALERAAQADAESETGKEEAPPAVIESAEERAESEQKQAIQQWLRRVPDDPGGLLRQKFLREYQRRRQQQGDEPR